MTTPLNCICPDCIARPDQRCPTHGWPLPIDLPDEFDPLEDQRAAGRAMAWIVGAFVASIAAVCTIAFFSYMAGAASVAP